MFTQDLPRIRNWINGQFVEPAAHSPSSETIQYLPVTSPYNAKTIGHVPLSSAADVAEAVAAAREAFPAWSGCTIKDRAGILIRFHALMTKHADILSDMVVLEHGKNKAEALASVSRGQDLVEYAMSLPHVSQTKILEVSRGITCYDSRVPLGVVASIVPFNFPVMVPLWTLSVAIVMGNTMVLKPSEKVPFTMTKVVELLKEAGLPDGVINLVNGTAEAANALIDHPDVKAVTFAGTSQIAEIIAQRCHRLNKRVLALGGAKNYTVSAPDCDIEMTSTDLVESYSGCSGESCMAPTVLLTIGHQQDLIDKIVSKSEAIRPGSLDGQMGPVIDQVALDSITRRIDEAEVSGARILVDGRRWTKDRPEGYWVGPTVILHTNKQDALLHEELFGPVLSILEVETAEEAIAFENANPYGNGAGIYTSSGATADFFIKRFNAGMCGINVGSPVPREPFSFGGWNKSRFGNHCDITGDGGVEFFSMRKKVTTKWVP
ncbi:Methylmalonate-semialdehyde dehydrogenase [Linnemannia elongata AG-77]|uniref:Methylmalonate-semialdehyde dehydrogenase n=1 Tax=Linnemannia elongata AG-77 TaxID=1314771 RepID=A0A197JPF9_9FUNG|nr:Methylmalonate-semialdehyde dehydrogenase [Linnemannia elongata AG-77]